MLTSDGKITIGKDTLVAFDLDGTLTKKYDVSSWETVHRYFGTWESHGLPVLQAFLANKISYYEFCKKDAEAWINKTEREFQSALDTIQLREGASEFVSFLKQKGCTLVIISMGIFDIVEKVGKMLEFDYWVGNRIIRRKGLITGDIQLAIGWKEKGTILKQILSQFNISPERCIAIGDATADLEMFEVAAVSIAIEPSSEKVAKAADFVCESKSMIDLKAFFKP
ncbi:MAG: HAD family hydrolase [Candidatus Hodarchaeales archaeon]